MAPDTVTIIVPSNVNLDIDRTKTVDLMVDGAPWSYYRCVRWVIDTHPSFNHSGPGVRAGARIITELKSKTAGERVTFDKSDWSMLEAAMDAPSNGWVPELTLTLPDGKTQPLPVPASLLVDYLSVQPVEP